MTKDQIQKHKESMLWFIDNPNKGLYCNIGTKENPDWHLTQSPKFNVNFDYVINDKYAEYRKAEVEGKNIQFRTPNHFGKTLQEQNEFTEWVDGTMKMFDKSCQYSGTEFRIKATESKFKVGDSVRYIGDFLYSKNKIFKITGILDEYYVLDTGNGKDPDACLGTSLELYNPELEVLDTSEPLEDVLRINEDSHVIISVLRQIQISLQF